MLAQPCDLPFSGGSVGTLVVVGALSLLAGVVILVLQRRSGRPVTPLILVGLVAVGAVIAFPVRQAAASTRCRRTSETCSPLTPP
jgi:hypothetical protein